MASKVKTSVRWREVEAYLDRMLPGLIRDMANAVDLHELGQAQGRYQMALTLRALPEALALGDEEAGEHDG